MKKSVSVSRPIRRYITSYQTSLKEWLAKNEISVSVIRGLERISGLVHLMNIF